MKIALALNTLNPATGGVVSATVELARALHQRGHSVTLLTFDAPQSPHLAQAPTELTHLALGPTQGSYGYTTHLRQKLVRASFDFLLLNGLWQYSTAGLARWATAAKLPFAIFPHGMLDPYFARAHPLKHLKKLLYWLLVERHTLGHARAVLYATVSEHHLAQKTFPFFPNTRQEVIGLGLQSSPSRVDDAKAAFFKAFPQLIDKPYLLYLSRLHPKKGADLLLQAHQDFPQLPLVMAGPLEDAPPKFLNRLLKLAGPQVVWTDLLTGPAKWGALAGARGLILPSHQENFGMVVAEALSVGTPAFLTPQVALAPTVLAYHAGFVADDTLEGVRQLLQKFSELSPGEFDALRQNAQRCYQENFLPDAVATRLEKLLQELSCA